MKFQIHFPKKITVAVALLALMAIVVVVLRIRLLVTGEANTPKKQVTVDELMKQVIPSDDQLKKIFLQSLGTDSLQSVSKRLLTADSTVLNGYVSKPEGAGPFPFIILLHDMPSSTKMATTVSENLGEDLANTAQSVVVSLDYRDVRSPSDLTPDIAAAIQFRDQFRETIDQPIFIVSAGAGSVAVLAAATDESIAPSISGIVFVNGYRSPAKAFTQLQATNEAESRFFSQYFDCGSPIGGADTAVSEEGRQVIDRCLIEFEQDKKVSQDIPVLSLRTTNFQATTDAMNADFATLIPKESLTESRIETADVTGAIFVNATSPEFLRARTTITDWIRSVADAPAADTQINEESTQSNTNSVTNTNSNANSAVTQPIIVE